MDFGEKGYYDTIRVLEAENIQYFGAGTLSENCSNPLVINLGGQNIGLLGYVCPSTSPIWARESSPGVMPLELHRIVEDVAKAKVKGASRIIVSVHWGAEEVRIPKPQDVKMAHKVIDAGAELIIGHHSHCIQSLECYRGKTVFYGLGNCVFPRFELAAYYDAEGNPQEHARAQWHRWNKESLMVSLDVHTSDIAVRKLFFENDMTLVGLNNGIAKYSQSFTLPEDILHAMYKRSSKYCLLRSAVASFLSKPRIPKMRTIMELVRLFSPV
jgi:hypothetical protein